jgi:hypothetical protein
MGRMWCSGWNLKHGGRTAGARSAGRLLVTATALRWTVHDGNRRNEDRIGEEMLVAVADCSLSVLVQRIGDERPWRQPALFKRTTVVLGSLRQWCSSDEIGMTTSDGCAARWRCLPSGVALLRRAPRNDRERGRWRSAQQAAALRKDESEERDARRT